MTFIKTRIAITLILGVLWTMLKNGVFYSADVVAKNTAAVGTLNGGDVAFATQQTYQSAPFLFVSTLAVLGVLAFIWAGPIKSAGKAMFDGTNSLTEKE